MKSRYDYASREEHYPVVAIQMTKPILEALRRQPEDSWLVIDHNRSIMAASVEFEIKYVKMRG